MIKTVAALALAALAISADAAQATPPDSCAVVLNTPDGFLAFRKGPGAQFRMLQKLNPGDAITVYWKDCNFRPDNNATCKPWVKAWTKDDTIGWVRSKYIQLVRVEFECVAD